MHSSGLRKQIRQYGRRDMLAQVIQDAKAGSRTGFEAATIRDS